MVPVPGDTFTMGSPNPIHSVPGRVVDVAPFCIDRTEVTVAQYQECVRGLGCSPPPVTAFDNDTVRMGPSSGTKHDDEFCNAGRHGRANHPLTCVDAEMADDYCTWKGGRLPTEEEWEFAARGSDGRFWPWGDAPDAGEHLGNTCGRECGEHIKKYGTEYPSTGVLPDTASVGSFPANASPFGVLDMIGSVEEWTSSKYCLTQGQPPAPLAGPCEREGRNVRGSGFPTMAQIWHHKKTRMPTLGFRCVKVSFW
jgi:formylglycine-generating enzyme required for sulfatase activity